ncbi:MAG: cell wall-active antibiotics response protein [candidate division Zixibacteria bacterium]|nr:cell wall-active antibiotics response protein [candidate division Zixibacteria bacterium]
MSGPKVIFGLVLILLGTAFLLVSLDVLDLSFGDITSFIGPVALIAVGIWLILRRQKEAAQASADGMGQSQAHYQSETNYQSQAQYQPPPPPPPGSGPGPRPYSYKYTYEFGGQSTRQGQDTGGKVRYQKFIGDMFIDCKGVELHNIEVSAFIGDNEIKLHGGKLSPGLNRLVISGFIGDVRVLVPPDMPVLCTSSSFIGDVELLGKRSSGLGNTIESRSGDYDTAEAKLFIAVNHFIGDVRVYVV